MTTQDPIPTGNVPEATPDTGAPADSGTTEVAEAPAATPDEPTISFDVDGEQVTVRQSEAPQFFLRQRDYTQKTQTLASEREALREAEALRAALEADPAQTVAVLQDAYGLSPAQAQQLATQEPEYVDPEEQRLQKIEGTLSQFEQHRLQSEVEAEFQALEQQVGAVDRNLLLAHAVETGAPNLTMAYNDMAYRYQQAQAAQQAQRDEQDATITEQKRGQSFVEGGHSPASGTVVAGQGEPIEGVGAAYALAKRQLGY